MVALAHYDQRFVRRDGDIYRMASSTNSLCGVCGDEPRCQIKHGMNYQAKAFGVEAIVSACGVFHPVLMFKDDTGLNSTFNTFRRGPGWYRRVQIGARVRCYSSAIEDFVADGVVIERHVGALGDLLEKHASFNHLLRDGNYADADARLQQILVRLYGKGYAAPSEEYSVIYVEVKT